MVVIHRLDCSTWFLHKWNIGWKWVKIRSYNFDSQFFSGGRTSGFWNIDSCCDVTILEKQLLGQNFDLRYVYQFFEIAEAYIDHQHDVRTRIKILKFVKPVLRSRCICLKMVILILLSPFVNVVRIRTILDQIWGSNNKEISDTSQKGSKGWRGIRIL